jgi:hypothetical protein
MPGIGALHRRAADERRPPSWEIGRNQLIAKEWLKAQLGKICKSINAVPQILIPPFPGSNPGAPATLPFAVVRAPPQTFIP